LLVGTNRNGSRSIHHNEKSGHLSVWLVRAFPFFLFSFFPFYLVQCNVRWVKKKMADKAEALRKEEEELKLLVSDARELGKKIIAISDKISEQAGDEKFRQALEKQQEKLERQQQELKVQIAKSEVKIAEWKEKGEEEIAKLQDVLDALRKPAVGAVLRKSTIIFLFVNLTDPLIKKLK